MIVLSYGITKSGSTLAFELCKALLEARGHRQRRLPDHTVAPRHSVNFMVRPTPARLLALLDAVPATECIAIKLHGALPIESENLLRNAAIQSQFCVQVSYRDPREICLSLRDAGAQCRAREPEATRGFGTIHTLEQAAAFAGPQLTHCRQWAALPGALPLYYEDVAFTPEATLQRMSHQLGLAPLEAAEQAAVIKAVFEHTHTQRNKAVRARHCAELTAAESESLLDAMPIARDFIERACLRRDYAWLADAAHD